MDRRRLCGRPGCGQEASASLTFQYGTRRVWLDDLGDVEPATIDLCGHHADRLSVPVGWSGQDRRTLPGAPELPASVAV
jgi:hypothetical protein